VTNSLMTRPSAHKKAVDKANECDSILLKFGLAQFFGRAPKPPTGDKENPVYIKGVENLRTSQ
jgi:hypothetical protein